LSTEMVSGYLDCALTKGTRRARMEMPPTKIIKDRNWDGLFNIGISPLVTIPF
jgi:hypothetical protein